MDKHDRLYYLFGEWTHHIKTTPGHEPRAHKGGTARHDTNQAATYIRCCACDWHRDLDTVAHEVAGHFHADESHQTQEVTP